jgi:serine/threonine-protein kinase
MSAPRSKAIPIATAVAALLAVGSGIYALRGSGNAPVARVATSEPETSHAVIATTDTPTTTQVVTPPASDKPPQTESPVTAKASVEPPKPAVTTETTSPAAKDVSTATTAPAQDQTNHTPPTVQTTALVTPSPEAIRQTMVASLRTVACSVATLGEDMSGNLVLRGVAARGAPEAALHEAVQNAAPTKAVDWQVSPVEGPYCGVLNLVRPFVVSAANPDGRMSVRLANGRTSLTAGDLVVTEVNAPSFGRYLQLDYISSDGSVLHMHNATGATPHPSGASPVFGQPKPPGFKGWAVDEPFGTDLIVAVESSRPLFGASRPETEKLATYERDLRASIDSALSTGARLSAAVLAVQTSPEP